MKHGSLFSGKGGFDLAAQKAGFENLFHCEIDEFNQQILKYYWPKSVSYGNIKQSNFAIWRGKLDILSAGIPCQDASNANQGETGKTGLKGERTGLFWELPRVIHETRPKYIVLENVENILRVNGGKDFATILSELARMGYNAEWRICRASDVGAPHHRSRMYMVAYPNSIRVQGDESFFSLLLEKAQPKSRTITGTNVEINADNQWLDKSPTYTMDDGISERLGYKTISAWLAKSIFTSGNAVVPEIPYRIFKAIDEYEKTHRFSKG